ncbi:MAG: SAM-dependent methyltransferase [Clostridia bacterium]|nr:SAM-dependent methyltransferase [Clostridia bacterium]
MNRTNAVTSVTPAELICKAQRYAVLRKVIFSKPADKQVRRAVLSPRIISGKSVLQLETFTADNKALHRNLDPTEPTCTDTLTELIGGYAQINILTTAGEAEYRRAKSGKTVLIGGDKLNRAIEMGEGSEVHAEGNNKVKQHILTGDEPFLKYLDVSDNSGRIHDKKQAKFRQINRFLEQVRDILPHLPAEGVIRVCDLCCGKSYLSFAIYHYLTAILGREVEMTGMDLKADVIEYCNKTARDLNFRGLTFYCGDISAYEITEKVHMVVSLHACDTATDMVLEKAIAWDADVILSTPCCHHALNQALNCPELAFIAEYGMLRQKLCDAATDALRLKLLEANGYETAALELIDPENTPKNILLRAVRSKKFDPGHAAAKKALAEYEAAKAFLMRQ